MFKIVWAKGRQKSPSILGADHTVDTIALSLIRGAKAEAQHMLTSVQAYLNLCRFRARGCQTTHSSRAVLRSCSLCHQALILRAGLVDLAWWSQRVLMSMDSGSL